MKKNLMILVFVFFIIGVGVIINSYLSLDKEYSFDTYQEATGIVNHGWIPKGLPENVYDLYVTYNLDSNNCNGYFSINDKQGFINLKEKVDSNILINLKTNEGSKMNDNIRRDIIKNNKKYIVLRDEEYVYAINEKKVYFWFLK